MAACLQTPAVPGSILACDVMCLNFHYAALCIVMKLKRQKKKEHIWCREEKQTSDINYYLNKSLSLLPSN